MITLRMESQQFVALHTGFNAAASDPDAPIDPTLITGVQSALAEAKATALPGLPVLVLTNWMLWQPVSRSVAKAIPT